MAKIQGKQLVSPIILSGSFSGSFEGDGSNLTGISGGNIETGSFATTGSNIFIGDQIVTGSVNISGSLDVIAGITGSLLGTASFATNALTASFAISASHEIIKEVSSSHADTASFAGNLFGTPSIVVSNITASNISASGDIVANNLSGTNTGDQDLSNLVTNAQTASFAITGSDVIFGNITSSGNISASGDLSIEGFPSVSASLAAATGSIPTLQQVTDQGSSTTTAITASIISASGQIQTTDVRGTAARNLSLRNVGALHAANEASIRFQNNYDVKIGDADTDANETHINVSDTNQQIDLQAATINLHAPGPTPASMNLTGHITASGNMSASGNIFGSNITQTQIQFDAPIISGSHQHLYIGDVAENNNGLRFNINDNTGTVLLESLGAPGNANLHVQGNLTASGNISASGNLFANVTDNNDTSYKTVVYDPATGQFFRTGSYGGGGGSTPSLQEVMDVGSSTTTAITASIISASGNIIGNNGSFASEIAIRNGNGSGILFSQTPDKLYFNNTDIIISLDDSDQYKFGLGGLTSSKAISASGYLAVDDIHANNFRLMTPLDATAGPFPMIKTTGTHVASTAKIFIGDTDEFDTNSQIQIDPPNETATFVALDTTISGSLTVTGQATNTLSVIGNASATGNISASGNIFGATGSFNQISANPVNVKANITMGGDSIDIGNTSTAASLGGSSFPFTTLAGSTNFQGMVAATNFLVGSGSAGLGGIPTTSTLRIGGVTSGFFATTYDVSVDITGNVTASNNISASGDIVANKVTADVVDTSFETFLNFEAATAFTFIAPFPMTINFTGSSTSSMDIVDFVTASANTTNFSIRQNPPITLDIFDKLKITPSPSGLFSFSGSRTI